MKIDDSGFKDFRTDASCLIRPQSLIGEKFIDCTPDPAARARARRRRRRSRRSRDGQTGGGPVPAAAREQRQDRRPRSDPEHPAAALSRPLPADPQRPRRRPRRAAARTSARSSTARTRRCARPIASSPSSPQQNKQLASLASNGDTRAEAAGRQPHPRHRLLPQRRDLGRRRPPSAAPALEEGLRKFPATLRQVRLTMTKLKTLRGRGHPALHGPQPGRHRASARRP